MGTGENDAMSARKDEGKDAPTSAGENDETLARRGGGGRRGIRGGGIPFAPRWTVTTRGEGRRGVHG